MPTTFEDGSLGTASAWHGTSVGRRVGYLVAAALNIVLLWASHQLLDWGWPGFLTEDFTAVLGIITASFVANVLVNLALAVYDRGRFRVLTELVTTWFGLAVSLRLLEVFPFDFSHHTTDWAGAVLGLLVLLIAVTGIAMVVNLVKLVAGPGEV